LLSEQVVDEGRFDGSVVVHQLQHVTALLIANMVNETCWEAVVASFKASQWNVVNSKLYNSKFHDDSNFTLNLRPKEDKFIQIYLVISKTLIIRNSKEKAAL
jgi:hypothetical protein